MWYNDSIKRDFRSDCDAGGGCHPVARAAEADKAGVGVESGFRGIGDGRWFRPLTAFDVWARRKSMANRGGAGFEGKKGVEPVRAQQECRFCNNGSEFSVRRWTYESAWRPNCAYPGPGSARLTSPERI
jgi:hypothetical protein